MNEQRKIAYWEGKPVEDMSKEELICALERMSNAYHRTLIESSAEMELLGKPANPEDIKPNRWWSIFG